MCERERGGREKEREGGRVRENLAYIVILPFPTGRFLVDF